MNGECLKLTTYFGERERTPGGLLADELMDLYGTHRLRMSVLLRGAEGFGRRHRLHTDMLLSLSEDPPVVSVAIDARERIEELYQAVLRFQRSGLVTIERAWLLTSGLERARLPAELAHETKLTVYVGRRQRIAGAPAYAAVTELLHRRGIAGATVLLGVDGTRNGERLRARFLARNSDVPTMILAVGSSERIQGVLPELARMLHEPLLTVEPVRVCKRDGRLLAAPDEPPATDEHGRCLWQKLMIYTSQTATHEGHPVASQIVRRLRESDAAGATSLRGIWGFHGEHPPHGDRLLQLRRNVPVLTVAVDTPERIARAFAIVDELTAEHGLVTSEPVPVLLPSG